MVKERFKSGYIGDISAKADILVIDNYVNKLVMISSIINNKLLKKTKHDINISSYVCFRNDGKYLNASTHGYKYDVFFKNSVNNDDGHFVANVKDTFDDTGIYENIVCYIYKKPNDTICDLVYDKLYKYTAIPLLKEWMNYIVAYLSYDKKISQLDVITVYKDKPFDVYKLCFKPFDILSYVQEGLKNNSISMKKNAKRSEIFDGIDGLDSYLSVFGDVLAKRIQNSFVPRFDPAKDKYDDYVNYYDDSCHYNGLDLYPIQKAAIQSSINNLYKNKISIVIGEMGIGKSCVAGGISYGVYKKKSGSSNLILCPSHLITNWKNEISKYVPNSKTYVIRSIDDIQKYDHIIRNKNKKEHAYFIVSKETAKFSYEKRPCAVWSEIKKGFVCPECGKLLTKRVKNSEGDFIYVPLEKEDFLKEYSFNRYCTNHISVFNKETKIYEDTVCKSKLWTALNKEERNMKWIKLGKSGWILKEHLYALYNKYNALVESGTRLINKDNDLYNSLVEAKSILDNEEKFKGLKAPRKYTISRYLKENYNNVFNCLILDEMHKYYGDSLQGNSVIDLCKTSKYVIGLTGTLMNGMAKNLFYILYRLFPRTMSKGGFNYNSMMDFSKQYGVTSISTKYSLDYNRKIGPSKENTLPGVSPMLFTKFLLENVVFLSLADIDGGLPAYREIPIGVDMDNELKEAYLDFEERLRYQCSFGGHGGMKILGAFLHSLSVYPDMPYDQPSIYHPDTNEFLVAPMQLSKGARNKENAVLDIVKDKVNSGEKVLVYYHYTKRCDAAQKLKDLFKDNGLKADIFTTSSCKSEEREDWINKRLQKGTQVLLCNSELVETGLNLLDFTTIIFYQISYKLFNVRQASRRSWRLSQTKDVSVYFVYYKDTIQEQAVSLLANKMNAALCIEGKFNEEGLRAMGDNDDISTKIAQNVVNGIKDVVKVNTYTIESSKDRKIVCDHERVPYESLLVHEPLNYDLKFDNIIPNKKIKSNKSLLLDILNGKITLANY